MAPNSPEPHRTTPNPTTSRDAHKTNAQLAQNASSAATPAQWAADQHLADASQRFFDGSGDRSEDLAQALAEVAAARADDATNMWIAIAQFYIHRELEDWDKAGRRLAEIAAQRPCWLAPEWITARTAEFERDHDQVPNVTKPASFAPLGAVVRAVSRWFDACP